MKTEKQYNQIQKFGANLAQNYVNEAIEFSERRMNNLCMYGKEYRDTFEYAFSGMSENLAMLKHKLIKSIFRL